jgi:hypothetical protein
MIASLDLCWARTPSFAPAFSGYEVEPRRSGPLAESHSRFGPGSLVGGQ